MSKEIGNEIVTANTKSGVETKLGVNTNADDTVMKMHTIGPQTRVICYVFFLEIMVLVLIKWLVTFL
jgi:hypothetical protein